MSDPREQQYETERRDLAVKVHKAMLSSYIGPPRPMLLGDAGRAVAAVITAGWQPPAEVEQLRAELADLRAFHQRALNLRWAVGQLTPLGDAGGETRAVVNGARSTLNDLFNHPETPDSLRLSWDGPAPAEPATPKRE